MSGNKILFDTNVLIRFLNGEQNLAGILDDDADRYISFLTEIELFCKPELTTTEKQRIAELVSACSVLPYSEEMKDIIVVLRTRYKLKMPDAFVAAAALYFKLPLYTYNKGFHRIRELDILSPK